jgi:hypothetical protein
MVAPGGMAGTTPTTVIAPTTMSGERTAGVSELRSAPEATIGSRSETAAAWTGEAPLRTTDAALGARETASGAAEPTRRVGETTSRAGEAASRAGEAASRAGEAGRVAKCSMEGVTSAAAAMILTRLRQGGRHRAHNEPSRKGLPCH